MAAGFSFYFGDNSDTVASMRVAVASTWGDVDEVSVDSFHLFIPHKKYAYSFFESNTSVGAISGYVRRDDLDHVSTDSDSIDRLHGNAFIKEMATHAAWPLGGAWTGSFAAVIYEKLSRTVTCCNDVIGCIPLYHANHSTGLIGGTSEIILGKLTRTAIDTVGVIQRITVPYCNYGRRTLLKGVHRILPGECARFTNAATVAVSTFDNSLYNGVISGNVDTVAQTVWNCYQQEIYQVAGLTGRVGIALSGGWDCRLVLAGIRHRGENIDCYHYGGDAFYESKLARRCAEAVGAYYHCYPVEETLFPTREVLTEFVKLTEAANILAWMGLLTNIEDERRESLLLMGEVCDGLDARGMHQLSSKQARIAHFLDDLIGKPREIAPSSSKLFQEWQDNETSTVFHRLTGNMVHISPELLDGITERLVKEETLGDLELSFSRMRQNMPPFAPAFDELFTWFHKTRFLMGTQQLLLSSRFRVITPGMSLRFCRLVSTIHPKLKIRRLLIDTISRLPEMKGLTKLPSAAIPWVSVRSPRMLQELIWGGRSMMDDFLGERAVKKRNPSLRFRVLPTMSYLPAYRMPSALSTIEKWFSEKWICSQGFIEIARQRGELTARPFTNLDIAAPANVSIILDLCRES